MSDPTLAEVADKTVDHIANGVQQIAATIEKLAPGAWEIAVRQHRTEGIVDVIIGVFFVIVFVVVATFTWRAFQACNNDADRGAGRLLTATICTGLIGIFVGTQIRPGVLEWTNPEYYAAQAIIAAVHR